MTEFPVAGQPDRAKRARRGLSRLGIALAAVLALGAAACSAPSDGRGAAGSDSDLVLADAYENESLHPLLGYAQEGASKIFDGLYAYRADRTLVPALAVEAPKVSANKLSWTVKLRDGVRFHDGSTFEARDVVGTFRALADPAFASSIASEYSMIKSVREVDEHTVRFDLNYPYSPLPHKLTLGIVPSESVAKPEPLEKSPLGSKPIGTGPYKLTEWRKGDRMVLTANNSYWDGAPQVRKITIVFATDDNTRAQRQRAKEFDGTVLPPAIAQTFTNLDGYHVVNHHSADYRTIMLPSRNKVTGDADIRFALNYAVNRKGMIDAILAGHGVPAYTPIPRVLEKFFEPSATFAYDPARAGRILDEAGWRKGADGIRVRGGTRAAFTLMYPADDSVRKAFAQAFVSDARAVGIDVTLDGLGWEAIEPRMVRDALVLGGGNPFDPDIVTYPLLHSSYGGDGYNNPGYYNNPAVDRALDESRSATTEQARIAAFKKMQRAFVAKPGFVFLVFLDHSYVLRDGWSGYQPVIEPHSHGVTWGPWWNVQRWTRPQ